MEPRSKAKPSPGPTNVLKQNSKAKDFDTRSDVYSVVSQSDKRSTVSKRSRGQSSTVTRGGDLPVGVGI